MNCSQIHECGIWETEHYNSVLEITRALSFISGKTYIGTRHFIRFSPALYLQCRPGNTEGERGAKKPSKIPHNLSAGIFRTTKVFDFGFYAAHFLCWLFTKNDLQGPDPDKGVGIIEARFGEQRIKFMGMFTVFTDCSDMCQLFRFRLCNILTFSAHGRLLIIWWKGTYIMLRCDHGFCMKQCSTALYCT
jgi:hypothetical protein